MSCSVRDDKGCARRPGSAETTWVAFTCYLRRRRGAVVIGVRDGLSLHSGTRGGDWPHPFEGQCVRRWLASARRPLRLSGLALLDEPSGLRVELRDRCRQLLARPLTLFVETLELE